MCAYASEVLDGTAPGPYSDELAELYAMLALQGSTPTPAHRPAPVSPAVVAGGGPDCSTPRKQSGDMATQSPVQQPATWALGSRSSSSSSVCCSSVSASHALRRKQSSGTRSALQLLPYRGERQHLATSGRVVRRQSDRRRRERSAERSDRERITGPLGVSAARVEDLPVRSLLDARSVRHRGATASQAWDDQGKVYAPATA